MNARIKKNARAIFRAANIQFAEGRLNSGGAHATLQGTFA